MNDSLMSSPDSKNGSLPRGGKQIRFAPSAKSGSTTRYGKNQATDKKMNRPILSDDHE